MDITIHASFLPQDEPDAALAFYRDTSASRYATTSATADALDHRRPTGQPGTSIVLYPPEATPGVTEDERGVSPR